MRLLWGAMVSLVLLSTPAQAWEWRWPWASADESANKLFVEAVPLWNQYQALPEEDPAQYEARLQLLNQIDENLKSILQDYPESSLAVELVSTGAIKQLDQKQIEAEIPRLQQSIPASALMAETQPLWEQYQALPTDDPSQYEARLQLLTQIDANLNKVLKDYPQSYGVGELSLAVNHEVNKLSLSIEAVKAEVLRLDCMSDVQCRLQLVMQLALKAAEDILQDYHRAEALIDVYDVLVASGDLDNAKTTLTLAQKAAESSSNVEALISVSEALAALGDFDGAKITLSLALTAADSFLVPDTRTTKLTAVYISVYGVQSASDDVDGANITLSLALKTAEGMPDDYSRGLALASVSDAQAASGDVDGALKTTEGISNISLRAKALSVVSEALAASGDLGHAKTTLKTTLTLAQKAAESSSNVEALISVSEALAALGDFDGAKITLSLALEAAESISSANRRGWVRVDISKAQAASGDFAGALQTAEGIADEIQRANAFVDISKTQAKKK